MVAAAVTGQSRLLGGLNPGGPDDRLDSLTFYVHDVVLRSISWHLSWRLESATTIDRATLIVAIALGAVLGALAAAQPGSRSFIAVALLTGFAFTVVSVSLTPWEAAYPVTFQSEPVARYTALPIFLIEAALIVGVDHVLRGRGGEPVPPEAGRRHVMAALRPTVAVTALAAFLAVSWLADFRYPGARSAPSAHQWYPIVARWHRDCERSRTGDIILPGTAGGHWTIPCSRLHF